MAESYKAVANAASEGLKDVIVQRAETWFGIPDAGRNISVTAAPSEKGPEFDKGWTFKVDIAEGAARKDDLRVAAASALSNVVGVAEGKDYPVSMSGAGELKGSAVWVARSLTPLLAKIQKPEIDAFVDKTLSESAERLARHKEREEKEFRSVGDPEALGKVTQDVVAKVREALKLITQDDPYGAAGDRLKKLEDCMPAEQAALALGLAYNSNFSHKLSDGEWDEDGKPMSSRVIAQALEADKGSVLAEALDTRIKDILLQYTRAHKDTTDYYASGRTMDDVLSATATTDEGGEVDKETFREASNKIAFCAFHVIEQALPQHIASDFRAKVSQTPINDILQAAHLEQIDVPANINRDAFNRVVKDAATGLRDEFLNESSPWVQTPQYSLGPQTDYREPFLSLDSRMLSFDLPKARRAADLPERGEWQIVKFLRQEFGEAGEKSAEDLSRQVTEAIKTGLKTCYPELAK